MAILYFPTASSSCLCPAQAEDSGFRERESDAERWSTPLQLCELKLGGKKPKTKNTQQVLALDPGLLLTLRQQEQLVPYGQNLIAS